MTRPSAKVDAALWVALCLVEGAGRATGRAGAERAAAGRVGAQAAPCGPRSDGGGEGCRAARLYWTVSPLPILPGQTPFLQFPQLEALWLTICKEFGSGGTDD